MKLTSVKVDWMDSYSNDPRWIVTFDQPLPDHEQLIHEERSGLYLASVGEYAAFLYYDRPGQGFGGRTFVRRTAKGVHELHGPWSSRAGCINREYPRKQWVVDVAIRDDKYKHSLMAGAATMSGMLRICKEAGITTVLCNVDTEPRLLPMKREKGGALWLKNPDTNKIAEVFRV